MRKVKSKTRRNLLVAGAAGLATLAVPRLWAQETRPFTGCSFPGYTGEYNCAPTVGQRFTCPHELTLSQNPPRRQRAFEPVDQWSSRRRLAQEVRTNRLITDQSGREGQWIVTVAVGTIGTSPGLSYDNTQGVVRGVGIDFLLARREDGLSIYTHKSAITKCFLYIPSGVEYGVPNENGHSTGPLGTPGVTVIPIKMPKPTDNDAPIISGVNLAMNISHECLSQLVIKLIDPGGRSVILVNRLKPSGRFGTGGGERCGRRGLSIQLGQDFTDNSLDGSDCPGDDLGSTYNEFTGNFNTGGLLNAFNGRTSNGVWKLRVENYANTTTCVSNVVNSPEFGYSGLRGNARDSKGNYVLMGAILTVYSYNANAACQ